MKKLNIDVYQGNPDDVVTMDNNNIFIEGDVEYNTGGGTKIKSITSIKNSSGTTLISGGSGGGSDPDSGEISDSYNIEAISAAMPVMWETYNNKDYVSSELVVRDSNNKIVQIGVGGTAVGGFAQKVINALDNGQAAMYGTEVNIGRNCWVWIYDIQPDGLENFRFKYFNGSKYSSGGVTVAVPSDTTNFLYGGHDISGTNEDYVSPAIDSFVTLDSIVTNAQDSSVTAAWRGLVFFGIESEHVEHGDDKIYLGFWLDGQAAYDAGSVNNVGNYMKIVGIVISPSNQ